LTKSKGEGSVTNCHALADIPQQGIRNRSLIWRKPRLEFISIDIQADLELFLVGSYSDSKRNKIIIWMRQGSSIIGREFPFDNVINNKTLVKFGATDGNLPKPFIATIWQVITDAKKGV
jgi:hypothetical protein